MIKITMTVTTPVYCGIMYDVVCGLLQTLSEFELARKLPPNYHVLLSIES